MAARQWSSIRTVPPLPLFPARPIATNLSQLRLPTLYQHADQLLFAPCSPVDGDGVWALAQRVSAAFGCAVVCLPCGTASECGASSMDAYYARRRVQVLAGVVFASPHVLEPNNSVRYTIRLDGEVYMPGFNGTANEVSPGSCRPDDNMVFNSLFLPVQVAVEQAIVAARANASVPTPVWGQVWVQRFPGGGCHVDNKMLNVGLAAPSTLFALMLSVAAYVLSWVLAVVGVPGLCTDGLHGGVDWFTCSPFPVCPR